MTPQATILYGDAWELSGQLEPASVDCIVTSPPYWNLRDYGHDGQFGLEKTPEEYVAKLVDLFARLRPALKDEGTVWLNLGDSYAGNVLAGPAQSEKTTMTGGRKDFEIPARALCGGLKPKDLVGIPWSVAKALREPQYTGRLKRERDRVWLAATIDGEGTICGFRHERKDDGRIRTGVHLFITNSDTRMIDEALLLWPASRSEHMRPSEGHLGNYPVERWIVHGAANKIDFIREIYPYLVCKRRQALVAYNLLLIVTDAKRLGRGEQGPSTRAKRDLLVGLLSDLNQRREPTLPDWLEEPPSLYEPGWYLRSDIIWSKPNPMPESVTDRPTKSHEYLFLLAKNQRYYFDADAVREDNTPGTVKRLASGPVQGKYEGPKYQLMRGDKGGPYAEANGRNIRTVWTIATQPYPEAHFATFPPKLIEPCIKAGCPVGGTVLDPFLGSGTTAYVARSLGRNCVGFELNEDYRPLIEKRLAQGVLL